MIENLLLYFSMTVVIEGVVEWVKKIFKGKLPEEVANIDLPMIFSFILGLVFAFSAKIDIFLELGMDFNNNILGYILTAWVLSRGSNYLFDFIHKVQNPVPAGPKIEVDTDEFSMTVEENEKE